ncbi:methyltransferase family protein [Legionella tunisiensis]|uniref:methyltransferase family protein n=1 Tax=Legionella tunisiensis TaxID=1034944 RepID=UPI0018DDC2B5|nr:isoprenylcysteine carboxylmethyltransferase family protein [Legionella tunisiensis]
MALLLFVPAGTLQWLAAWVFIIENILLGLIIGIWLAKHDPALLKERLSFIIQVDQPWWDKILVIILFSLMIIWLPFIALDAVRFHYSYVPFMFQIIGALGIAISMYFNYLTFRENTFASPVVKIQNERKQVVISTGPYAYVRHPMYTGAVFYFFGTPLLLGSWCGLIFPFYYLPCLLIEPIWKSKYYKKSWKGMKPI